MGNYLIKEDGTEDDGIQELGEDAVAANAKLDELFNEAEASFSEAEGVNRIDGSFRTVQGSVLTLEVLDDIIDSMPNPEFIFVECSMKKLKDHFGSWVRIQVAFYDFIFEDVLEMCVGCTNQQIVAGFADGENFYEDAVKAIETKFKTFEEAWEAFKQSVSDEIKSRMLNQTLRGLWSETQK